MSRARLLPLLVPALLLVGCSGEAEPAEPASEIPAAWLEVTAEGWPDSPAHGSHDPVVTRDPCLLTEEAHARGRTARTDLSGWGAYGADIAADDVYRYVCQFRGDGLRAQLQVIQAGSGDDAQTTVEEFLDQPSTSVQENEPTTVRVGEVDVHVNHRVYPGTGTARATALFHDEPADAIAMLEIVSLAAADLADYPPEQVARDLMLQLARGGE